MLSNGFNSVVTVNLQIYKFYLAQLGTLKVNSKYEIYK